MVTRKKTCSEQLMSIVRNITVEPSAFLMVFTSAFASLATRTLNLDKTCRVNLNLSEEVCDAIRNQDSLNNTENEKIVQQYFAAQLVWQSALQAGLPCLLFPFVGGWLDLTGRRKLFMIIPVFGDFLQNLSNILNVIFFYQTPVQVVMFLDAFLTSITGGMTVMTLAMYSYITDVTTERNRTHRIGVAAFTTTFAAPLGVALSGIVLRQYGYYAIYCTSLVVHILNLSYVIFYLRDPPRSVEQKKHDGRGILYGLKTFFNISHLKNTFRVFMRKTEDKRILRLLGILISFAILIGTSSGEGSIMYLSTRLRFGWDEVQYSIYQTYNLLTNTAGMLITIVILAKLLHLHDSFLGLIACASKIAGTFVFCFAPTGGWFYLGPAVDMFSNTAFLAFRSMISKEVDPDELAKVNSLLGLFENLVPFAYVAMYSNMYIWTMEVLPGAPFLLGSVFALPAVCVFVWLYVRHRKIMDQSKVDNIQHKEEFYC